jgi:hypothetical protein
MSDYKLMERLISIMDTTTSTVMTSKDLMVDGMNATNLGLNTALGILDEIKELLESVI